MMKPNFKKYIIPSKVVVMMYIGIRHSWDHDIVVLYYGVKWYFAS
jgi:hypothetical protein